MSIVTAGDFVVWYGLGRLRPLPFSLAWADRLRGALSQDGWRGVQVQEGVGSGGLQITGICPRSYSNANWLYEQLADEANKAGWDIDSWRGTSAAQSPPTPLLKQPLNTQQQPPANRPPGAPSRSWDELLNEKYAGVPLIYWLLGGVVVIAVIK
jgi:hypothetical protein